MSVTILERDSSIPLVQVRIAVPLGSCQDPAGMAGLSTVTAQLMLRSRRSALDPHGASLSTSVTHSAWALKGYVVSRSFDHFLDALQTTISAPRFEQKAVAAVRLGLLRQAGARRENDRRLATDFYARQLFQGHPYARPTEGTADELRTIDVNAVIGHHGRCWVADNLIVGFAGDIDADTASSAAERLRAALPQGRLESDTREPSTIRGRHLVVVDRPGATQCQTLIGNLGTHPKDDDHPALLLVDAVLGATATSRLPRAVREERGWSYAARSGLRYDRWRRDFTLWTVPHADNVAETVRLELDLLEDLAKQSVSEAELAHAKRFLVKRHPFTCETPGKRVGARMSVELSRVPRDYAATFCERIDAVTRAQVSRSIEARLDPANLVITVVGPASALADRIRSVVPDLASFRIVTPDEV